MSFQICRQRRARARRRLDRSSVFAWACGGAVFLFAKKRTRIAGAASVLRVIRGAESFCAPGGGALWCFGRGLFCPWGAAAGLRIRSFCSQGARYGGRRRVVKRFGGKYVLPAEARRLAEKGGRRQTEKSPPQKQRNSPKRAASRGGAGRKRPP